MTHEWTCAASRPRAKNLPGNTLTPSYITLSSGDIKDLPKTVTDLNLALCEKLTGKEGREMAQSNTQTRFHILNFILCPSFPYTICSYIICRCHAASCVCTSARGQGQLQRLRDSHDAICRCHGSSLICRSTCHFTRGCLRPWRRSICPWRHIICRHPRRPAHCQRRRSR